MRVFVFEYITGGGLFNTDLWPAPESLLREGAAIAGALVRDLAAAGELRVSTLFDQRMPATHLPRKCEVSPVSSGAALEVAFGECARAADWTIVIAPEIDGHLLAWSRRVIDAGGRLQGPSLETIRLASDKHRTAEHLRANDVRAPHGVVLAPDQPLPRDFGFPAVLKPIDGAGSLDVQLVAWADQPVTRRGVMRLEQFHPGVPASVAVFCGPRETVPLLPCGQHLSGDGRFTYLGGSLPLEPAAADRAARLAVAAVRTLPEPLGYFGVDLVLGDDPSGASDVVIEINPRLTTSYVGLRAAARKNLAAGMMAIAEGGDWEPLWVERPVSFSADGTIES